MFRTEVPILIAKNPIDYDAKILSLGSCFAENISEKLSFYKFQNVVNPFGIIFNPISIERIITRIVNQELFTEKDIFYHNDRWQCFEIHSKLSHSDKDLFLENLNTILKNTFNDIQNHSHCIITYGTSWVYRHIETNKIVANCHKIPQNQFSKEILTAENISKSIENTINLIQKVNKNIRFIFTVSPVRHIKDGFVENNVSKSLLIGSVYNITKNNPIADYFPSYEILLDELRDYRFYADDMLHPSPVAISYIWNKFRENYIKADLKIVLDEVENIQKSLFHKPFDEQSLSHTAFLTKLKAKIHKIESQFPSIKF